MIAGLESKSHKAWKDFFDQLEKIKRSNPENRRIIVHNLKNHFFDVGGSIPTGLGNNEKFIDFMKAINNLDFLSRSSGNSIMRLFLMYLKEETL